MAVESSSSHQFMGKSRQSFLNQDISPDSSVKSRDWDTTSRWSEQSNPEIVSPSTSSNWKHTHSSTPPGNRNFQKARHMQWVFQLVDVAEGLMAKMSSSIKSWIIQSLIHSNFQIPSGKQV